MRYRVLDLPPKGAGAFCPIPTTNPVASSYGLVKVAGSPGTEPMPAPSPQRLGWLASLTRRGGQDSAQGSMVAPDVILPTVYVAYADNMGPAGSPTIGMAIRRRNPLPVPARNYIPVARVAQTPPRLGGRSTMVWPRAFQRFPAATRPA